jgi:cardiolipin synthase
MWVTVTNVLIALLSLFTLGVVVMQRREPQMNLAWALAVVFLPVLGPVLFFALAWRRPERETRQFRHKAREFGRKTEELAVGEAGPAIERDDLRAVADAVEQLEGFPARPGNRVDFAADGPTFRTMLLSGIREAERSVHLEFYIYHNDEAGNEVTEALCEKARDGVECRLLLDAVGALWFQEDCLARLRDAGVSVAFFHAPNLLKRRWQINYRLHRKIAVFDVRSALTGGRNVGNEYVGRRKGKFRWQDLSMFVHGPVVADLQQVFLADWFYTTNEHLEPRDYCPQLAEAGSQVVQVVPSHPHALGGTAELAYLLAVRTARESLRLVTPYFVPPESMLSALVSASLAGVDVEVVVPTVSDSRLTLWAGRSLYRQLIEAGIRIYEYQGGMLHGKLAIVDNQWCTAGSANLDCRSFRLSFEVNCFVYDRDASRTLTTLFQLYRSRAALVEDRHQYDRRLRDRLLCGFVRLAAPAL